MKKLDPGFIAKYVVGMGHTAKYRPWHLIIYVAFDDPEKIEASLLKKAFILDCAAMDRALAKNTCSP